MYSDDHCVWAIRAQPACGGQAVPRPYLAGLIGTRRLLYGRAAAALVPAVSERYPVVPAFLMASSASAVVINGVVFSLFTAPPAANAMAMAAALTLSGISVMTTTSNS